ncbi:hypothetical protein KFE98_04095 [bacterium SCSIO 12741]|nr:hypothetical protein KFE98_04095 [bacterium SCSIO 12741]
MKKILPFLIMLLSLQAFSQAPDLFSYQAVVRNSDGDVVPNKTVNFQFTIFENHSGGVDVYVETQTATTNGYGLVSLRIGEGTVVSGDFSTVKWGQFEHVLKVEVDPDGGTNYTVLSNSQLVSVPYALYAATSDNPNDHDQDSTNEIQTLSFNNDIIELSKNGGQVDLSTYALRLDTLEGDVDTLNMDLDSLEADFNDLVIQRRNDSLIFATILQQIVIKQVADSLTLATKIRLDSVVHATRIVAVSTALTTKIQADSLVLSASIAATSNALLAKIQADSLVHSANVATTSATLLAKIRADSIVQTTHLADTASVLRGLINSGGATDHDRDSTNEIQTISSSNDTIYLSKNGGFVVNNSGVWGESGSDIYYAAGNVAIGGSAPSHQLHVLDTTNQTSTTNQGYGVLVQSQITNSANTEYAGIGATIVGTDGVNRGVQGVSAGNSSGHNVGVLGYATDADTNIAVQAVAESSGASDANIGISYSVENGGSNFGMIGTLVSGSGIATQNIGIYNQVTANNGPAIGIYNLQEGSQRAIGIQSDARSTNTNTAIIANTYSTAGNTFEQHGVFGQARPQFGTGGSGNHYGVYGYAEGGGSGASQTLSSGLFGEANSGSTSSNSDNRGVTGIAESSTTLRNEGVAGFAEVTNSAFSNGFNAGLSGFSRGHSTLNYGVVGQAYGTVADRNYGSAGFAYGVATGGGKWNVGSYGYAWGADTNIALYGYAADDFAHPNIGVYSRVNTSTGSLAGYFIGNVTITGNLSITGSISKGSGTFKIDHPEDPENKFLVHSFVESPDMMNIYNGNIVTDAQGYATVTLPDYFDGNNIEYRYQLTPIGQFAQCIVKEEISGNQFIIQTDQPNVKVSWQVTGIRNDPYAQQNRIVPVQDKNAEERGKYLHPEAYGQPATKAMYQPLKQDKTIEEIKQQSEGTRGVSEKVLENSESPANR